MADMVQEALRARVATGALTPDRAQQDAAARLDALLLQAAPQKPAWFGLGRGRAPAGKSGARQGVWLYGPVGTGKSMLMDMACARAAALYGANAARRVHFHDFMGEAHAFIAQWRRLDDRARRKHPEYVRGAGDDPVPPAARAVIGGASLICLDEAEITDIADAMLVGRLFQHILSRGVTVLVTSNRAPDGLYKDGVNRQLFLPFIALITDRLEVVELDSGRDWRRSALSGEDRWLTPMTEETRARFDALWARIAEGGEHAEALSVNGRDVAVPRVAGGCCRFDFDELCGAALGAADYLALARRYRVLFLDNIPALTPDVRDKARRFVTLIDALYESGCGLVALAAAQPDALYTHGDYAFEFRRAASRIAQLRHGATMRPAEAEHAPTTP